MDKVHYFSTPAVHLDLPEKFTYPFHYTPHPLCLTAAEEVQKYLQSKEEWKSDLQQGKMFGVLIVQTPQRDRLSGSILWHPGGKESARLFRSSHLRPSGT